MLLSQGWRSTESPSAGWARAGPLLHAAQHQQCLCPYSAAAQTQNRHIFCNCILPQLFLEKNLRAGEQILILFTTIPVLAGSKAPFYNIFRCTAWLMVQGRLQVAAHNDTSSSEYLLPQQEAANPTQQASSSTLSKQTLCLHFPRDQSSSGSGLCFVQK